MFAIESQAVIEQERWRAQARCADSSSALVDLFFTDGDYSYVIASFDLPRQAGVSKQRRAMRGTKQVTNATINLYNRVHGAAVCP